MRDTLLVFDQDGTLTKANTLVDWQTFKSAIAVLFNIPTEKISDNLGDYPHITDSGIFDTLSKTHRFDFDLAQYHQFIAAYSAACCTTLPEEIPGAKKLLAGITHVAIATGAFTQRALARLAVVQTSTSLHPIATANDHITRHGIMTTAANRANDYYRQNFVADKIVYVGDAAWDAAACAQLGWRFVARCENPEKFAQFDVAAEAAIPNYTDQDRFWAAVAAARVPQRV